MGSRTEGFRCPPTKILLLVSCSEEPNFTSTPKSRLVLFFKSEVSTTPRGRGAVVAGTDHVGVTDEKNTDARIRSESRS